MASAKIYDRALSILEENQKRRKEGKFNCIPTPFERMEEYLPGIEKKMLYIVTASSGVGKSKFTKYFFVLNAYEFARTQPDMRFRIKYFCLEESKENFIHSLMCYKLYIDYGDRVPIKQLKSILKSPYLNDDQLEKIKQMKDYFHEFEEYVEVIDHIRHPTGIYKHVEAFMEANGKWTMKEAIIDGQKKMVKEFYISDHRDEYNIIIIDHISLLTPEKGLTLHQTISRHSAEYCIALRDKYGCTVVNVQQQAADTEKQQFTYKGQSIESKLEPSLAGLGDNKLTARDADCVIGLFAPDRYEIKNHRNYNILKWADHYRSLMVLKNRDGTPNARLGLYFDGGVNYFKQLPRAEEITEQVYKKFNIE